MLSALVLFFIGVGLLIIGADILVRGATRLSVLAGISPLVVGLTVVAFGTGSPELAVSILSVLDGESDIAVGNVVGSNILNVLLVLGASAVITPLVIMRQLIRIDVPIMIGAGVLVLLLALDNHLGAFDGVLLFSGIVAYMVFSVYVSRNSGETGAGDAAAGKLEEGGRWRPWLVNLALIAAGLVLLVWGSRWVVNGATTMAQALGISKLIIGLTIVAVGTSLPEVATSIVAAVRGQRDIAVGNVVGSNIFNLLAVLGLAGLVSPHGIDVSPAALYFDIPVMIIVSVACLPIFFTGHMIARWEGGLFLAYYIAYNAYLVMKTTEHDALGLFTDLMLVFILPLTAVTLIIISIRALRSKHNSHSGTAG